MIILQLRRSIRPINLGLWRLITFVFRICFILILFQTTVAAQTSDMDWERLARLKPDLRVMIRVTSPYPLSLADLASLAQSGMTPADRDPGMVLGLRQAIFSVKLKHWNPQNLPASLQATLLDRFMMTGVYRVSFRVEQEGYEGPLSLEITTPRDDFGKQLLASDNMVRPQAPTRVYVDGAENRWFCVDYPKIRHGETIRFHFAFKYRVDMAALFQHDLMLLEPSDPAPIPETLKPFLGSGYKIDINNPQVREWAKGGLSGGPLDVRSEYLKVKNYIKKTILYDNRKKARYFGGKAIYANLDDMYQDIPTTLSSKLGACPDTSVLECGFLRAKGIPCRTAGRFGHFLTHLYVSGKGWLSTAIHPTGIPLVVAPGPDNVSYQKWQPDLQLKTVTLEYKIRIESLEDRP